MALLRPNTEAITLATDVSSNELDDNLHLLIVIINLALDKLRMLAVDTTIQPHSNMARLNSNPHSYQGKLVNLGFCHPITLEKWAPFHHSKLVNSGTNLPSGWVN